MRKVHIVIEVDDDVDGMDDDELVTSLVATFEIAPHPGIVSVSGFVLDLDPE